MTNAEILKSVEDLKDIPIDLNRWQSAVAELHDALLQPTATQELQDLRQRYGAAGLVMCYMTDEQRRTAEPQLKVVATLLRRFAQ